MKKIFIATLAVLAFAGCNNEKKAENVYSLIMAELLDDEDSSED